MKTASTTLHHLVTLEPSLHPFVREPQELGRLFGEKRELEFLGFDPERRGLLKFSGEKAREVFSSYELDPAAASYFLAIGSARGLKSKSFDSDTIPLATAVTRHGLSPMRKREAHCELTLSQNAELMSGIFKSVYGLNLRVEALPEDPLGMDGPWEKRRLYDMLRISGRVADVSRGLRAIVQADRDDRSPRRDGPQRLANAYSYFGDPWNDEVTFQFRDEFGKFSTGRDKFSLPVVSWRKPWAVDNVSNESAQRFMNEPMNYGFKLTCDRVTAGPFSSLSKLLQHADRMTTDMCRGKPIEMPVPSAEDVVKARQLHAAWANRSGMGAKAVDAFLAENCIGKLPQNAKEQEGRRKAQAR